MATVPNRHVYAVIMAGGPAKALWPAARKNRPVHCLDLFHEGIMIRMILDCIAAVVPIDRVFVITSKEGRECLHSACSEIRTDNILVEPVARNTAYCIALATAYIKKRDPDAITVVLPSDHHVGDRENFAAVLRAGIGVAAEKQGLVTIGVSPAYAETSYGYIQADEPFPLDHPGHPGVGFSLYRVKTFAEKPDYATAVQFLESRDFFWNSGIFIWHVDDIWHEFERSMPDLYKDLLAIYEHLGTEGESDIIEDVYSWAHPVSIDCGIMEKADSVFMIEGEFGWTDLVNWDEVSRVAAGIAAFEESCELDVLRMKSAGTFVRKPEGKVVCLIGADDLIVIDTGDALLICGKGESARVPEAVDQLRRENREELL
ncbi:MAG: mannose-1-phosphate guanyltransferase [Chlorobium sp.]|uniref:mannose-1-phosphate guanylyltransferase n=1 Tax=Chlorobium sp. TaxID=1095 RepID=UPI0025B8C5E6|nr:mannose-1-phosphate guanylyltransferase [Chlorobium sp.]MCF8216195.1 mannose-1-phosphate guanyltransferase [Chlorobium sp.]MCF8271058.1 mannose-1-phosphate guanyltransferase [Chlorobium sp.]MCF8287471.1 mannose-1-phosphate guanyltransferase [Chlorobium sp.]MCF8290971.1 mannose-1-phosphate guanyltransferase [Chlorobium sp.]MCF8385066.1 mannose-1-phosphate guanyltransferase [Chlorobium sp.]